MGWIEDEVLGGLSAQVNEKGGMHHWNSKASLPIAFPDGDVSRRSLVIALREVKSELSCNDKINFLATTKRARSWGPRIPCNTSNHASEICLYRGGGNTYE